MLTFPTMATAILFTAAIAGAVFHGVAAIIRAYYWGRAELLRARRELPANGPPPEVTQLPKSEHARHAGS